MTDFTNDNSLDTNPVFVTESDEKPIIKVIGVGGGGSNAVNNMYRKGIKDVEFIICNTDQQALMSSPVSHKLAIGKHGAGGRPEKGAQHAREHAEEISQIFSDNTSMVFIAACMGGGTGTGAAPVIAELIKQIKVDDEDIKDVLVVAVVTMPFQFEGRKRIIAAENGVRELKKYADSVIVINNDKLRTFGNRPMDEAFQLADEIVATATKSIAEIITNNLYINIDFHDVYTIMSGSKTALMGSGLGEGENRAVDAIQCAASSVLLNDQDVRNAKGCLLSITTAKDHVLTMDEFTALTNYVEAEIIDSDDMASNVIWGTGIDDSLGEKVQVTLIATGFESSEPEEFVVKAEGVTGKTIEHPTPKAVEPVEQKIIDFETQAPIVSESKSNTNDAADEGPVITVNNPKASVAQPKQEVSQPKVLIDLEGNEIKPVHKENKSDLVFDFGPTTQDSSKSEFLVNPAPATIQAPQPVVNAMPTNSAPVQSHQPAESQGASPLSEDEVNKRLARMKALRDQMNTRQGLDQIVSTPLVDSINVDLTSSQSEVSKSGVTSAGIVNASSAYVRAD